MRFLYHLVMLILALILLYVLNIFLHYFEALRVAFLP